MLKLKTLVLLLNVITNILLFRPFGQIIHDVAARYNDISIADLRLLEKLSIKVERIKHDIAFLKNCQTFQVFPKFLCFKIPHGNGHDTNLIRKRLLRSAIHKRVAEKKKVEAKLNRHVNLVQNILSGLDWLLVKRCIKLNVSKSSEKVVATHQKKLQRLTQNVSLPFTADDVITNLSKYNLSDEEKSLLKNGLQYAIPPRDVLRSDIFTSFEMLNTYLTSEIKFMPCCQVFTLLYEMLFHILFCTKCECTQIIFSFSRA